MTRTRGPALGPASRPVAIPADFDEPMLARATGVVDLPLRVRWDGPEISYDMSKPSDRARVYEIVLREGTEADVRYYVDPDGLIDLWGRLVLPPWVRREWAEWYRAHRGLDLWA